ncbi:MAG: DUF3300 domain-containing protein [Candidatus Thiodiazotropha sp.]
MLSHPLNLILSLALTLLLMPFPMNAADGNDATFSQAELDQIMAPVALYPDALLSQILMASTYPDQVAEAVKWSKTNTDQKGDDAVTAVQDKAWDPSVASLVAFPQVLAMMGDKPDWVKQMGDAFLAQPEDTMDTVQGLRKKAKEAGNLESSDQQKVAVDESADPTVIVIESSDPQVIYVPSYNPTIIYGTWWWPAYPPYYWPPPPGYGFTAGLVTGIGFGIGISITNSIWGGFNWHHHDVNINVNRYNKINVNRKLDVNAKSVSWKHNAVNRKGTPYADRKSREKFGQKLDGADKRQDFRGRDDQREQARAAMQRKGIDPGAERKQLTGSQGQQVRDRVSSLDRQRDTSGFNTSNRGGSNRTSQSSHALSGLGNRNGGAAADRRGSLSNRSSGSRSFGGGGHGGGGLGGGGLGGRSGGLRR